MAISHFSEINSAELWIAFGTKSNFRYIPVYVIANQMDKNTCKALPVFHAFTGCDTVSAFGGRGKKTAWNTWKVFPEVTEAFIMLLDMQDNLLESEMFVFRAFCSSDV